MRKNDGGPAFPHPQGWRRDPEISDGMSLRDYFAGKAMQGMLACTRGYQGAQDVRGQETLASRAAFAYEIADAMIKARGVE